MVIYIKDKETFATKVMAVAVEYQLHRSIYDATSTVTIQNPDVPIEEGDYLVIDGYDYVGILTEVDIDDRKAVLSASQGLTLFSREMFYTTASYTYLEDNLKSLLDTNYTNCSDAIYKVPFLTVNALSHTAKNCKPDLEDNVYTLSGYMSKLRRLYNIVSEWQVSRTALVLNIYKKDFPTYNIDLSNPRYRVTEQTFSSQSVGKVTVYCEGTGAYSTWYLKTDGTVTQTYSTANRVPGEWITLTVGEAEDVEDSVKDAFAQNYYSHRIAFKSEQDFNLYDQLIIRADGKLYRSYVSGIIDVSDSAYSQIECGELQTLYPYLNRI